jgi:hypothetical protein
MEMKENITNDDVETFNFIIRCMMQIENKLKIKMENNTRYTRHDIAIMDLVAAFFQETTNKLKNKRNEMEEILLS